MEVSFVFMFSTLTITPNRLQFFQYDKIELKCVANSTGWIVKRNIGLKTEECTFGWGLPSESSCIIENAYPMDTGVYWCESKKKELSNNITISVIAHGVILESPIEPVMEGNIVTICCSYRGEDEYNSKSDFSANFYKDGVFIGTYKAGNMTFLAVSKSDEGFYKCEHPSKGESRQSFLAVRVEPEKVTPTTSPSPPLVPWAKVISSVLLFVLYNVVLVLCIYIYRKWAQGRARRKASVCGSQA